MVLCFTVCAHRIYCGRYISGIVQVVWTTASSYWAYVALKGLTAIIHSGSVDLDTIDRISDWREAQGGAILMPILAVISVGIWTTVDAVKLARKKFTDGKGLPITRWI
jgi:hypothetical protein